MGRPILIAILTVLMATGAHAQFDADPVNPDPVNNDSNRANPVNDGSGRGNPGAGDPFDLRAVEAEGFEVPGVRSQSAQPESLLAAGSRAIGNSRYDDGIRLTLLGLEDDAISDEQRAAGLANVCAAHAAKREFELALRFCARAAETNSREWRAHSNRAYIYWQQGLVIEALIALDAATAINPRAEQVARIQRMIEESSDGNAFR